MKEKKNILIEVLATVAGCIIGFGIFLCGKHQKRKQKLDELEKELQRQ